MTVTFDNNLVTVSVEQEAKFWFSGKKIGCLTTVSNQIVSAETDFYTVTKSCPTLTRTNGEIILTDKLDGSNVVGKIATLKCDTESSYQPYKPPGGEAVTVVECLFSTCNKVIAIDYSKLNVGVFFKGANFAATCGSEAGNAGVVAVLNGASDKKCGWRSVNFPCYENGDCVFLPEKSKCIVTTVNGNIGAKIKGVFELKNTIDVAESARNDADSKWRTYSDQAQNMNKDYYTPNKKSFWKCEGARRRREVFERAAFHVSVSEDISTTTPTPTTTPTTPTKPTTQAEETDPRVTEKQVTEKQVTEKQGTEKQVTEKQVTEKQVTTAKQSPEEEVKTKIPKDVTLAKEEPFVQETAEVE